MAVVATPAVLCTVSVNGEPKEGGAPANFLFTMMGNVPPPEDEVWEFGLAGGAWGPAGCLAGRGLRGLSTHRNAVRR
jgi:hypothetical protein